MDWYYVVKTINGRRYRYRQKTWREGGRVRTRSEYIGPADGDAPGRRRRPTHQDLSGATTLPLPFAMALPRFDKGVSDETFRQLTEKNCLVVPWEHHWKEAEGAKNLVAFDERVAGMLRSFEVKMTQEATGAYFSPRDDLVNIPPQRCFLDMNGQTATSAYHMVLFHELVHWTGGGNRIERKKVRGAFDRKGYAREELVAELGAAMLMHHFGMEIGNLDRHARYFQAWLGRAGASKAALTHAKREAARAVQYLLEGGIIA